MNVDMGTAGSLEDIVTATSLDLESSQFMREPAVKNPPAAAKHPDADLKHSVATAVAPTPSAPLPAPPAVPTNGSEVAQTSDAARKSGTQTGRRRVEVRFIEDKARRSVTFSKRKRGLIKKAYELSELTGSNVLLLMQSETKQVYTFATPAFQRVVSTPHGQAMIQKYLTEDAEEPSAMEVELVMQGGVLQPLYGENTDDIAAQQPTLDAASALVHSAAAHRHHMMQQHQQQRSQQQQQQRIRQPPPQAGAPSETHQPAPVPPQHLVMQHERVAAGTGNYGVRSGGTARRVVSASVPGSSSSAGAGRFTSG